MATLNNILGSNFITRKSAIHDCHDNQSNVVTLTTTPQKYTNDGTGGRNWYTTELWDTTNNIVDCSNLVVGSKLDISIDTTIDGGNKDTLIFVEFRCPNNGSPFTLKTITITIDKALTYQDEAVWNGYVGPEVQQYGIEIYSSASISGVDLSLRTILIRA